MDGILNINKAGGRTSFETVASVKRLCRERRVGHGGTLDPLATGVLPVFLGRATRVVEYLMEQPKEYRAEIQFGLISDSGDADGNIVPGGDTSRLDEGTVKSALDQFRGQIRQIPPMFSALKYKGRPLYELAREGITVERPARTADVYAIDLVSWHKPIAAVRVICGRGTYVRTLAQDIGQALQCGAYLKSLCRVAYGPFGLSDSLSLSQLEDATFRREWHHFVRPIDSVLLHLPSVRVPEELAQSIRHGRPVVSDRQGEVTESFTAARGQARIRAYTLDGCFIGVLRFNSEKDEWQAEKVFP